jgi:hypothetical protein
MENCCTPTVVDGYHYTIWIYEYFGNCAYTPLDHAAFFIGLSSIGFWLIAQFPYVPSAFKGIRQPCWAMNRFFGGTFKLTKMMAILLQ